MGAAWKRDGAVRLAHPTGMHHRRGISCPLCSHRLECVEQNRRSGAWLGLLLCPNCRSEYLYAYRSGRLSSRP